MEFEQIKSASHELLEDIISSVVHECNMDEPNPAAECQSGVEEYGDAGSEFNYDGPVEMQPEFDLKKQDDDILMEETAGLEMLSKLSLRKYFPHKLTKMEVLTLDQEIEIPGDDCPELKRLEYFLQSLIMTDGKIMQYLSQVSESTKSNYSLLTFPCKRKLESVLNLPCKDVGQKRQKIHPMDILLALLYCSDKCLSMFLVQKLFICKLAIPLVVPDLVGKHLQLLSWGLKEIKVGFKTHHEAATVEERLLFQTPTPIISFMRLSEVNISKSNLLNNILFDSKHDVFFHRDCTGDTAQPELMTGVIDISWYFPCGEGNEKFNEAVTFLNLHGDSNQLRHQVEFLDDISSVLVLLVTEGGREEDEDSILDFVIASSTPAVILVVDGQECIEMMDPNNILVGKGKRSITALSQIVVNKVRQLLPGQSYKSIRDVANTAKNYEDCAIKVDEYSRDCKEAEEQVKQVTKIFNKEDDDNANLLDELFCLQGKLWSHWAECDKGLYDVKPSEKTVENHLSKLKKTMKEIRQEQLTKGLSEPVKIFRDFLATIEGEKLEVFLKLLEISLRETTEDCSQGQTSLNHFMREIGQFYEASKSDLAVMENLGEQQDFNMLPSLAVKLLMNGFPLELMDGDCSHVPLTWIKAVIEELSMTIGNKKIFVMSVVGIESSGKSTLLNTLFGLQFPTSAGRCTKGAFVQLINLSDSLRSMLQIDFILVVDTEGLRSSRLNENHKADNRLATFAIGLGQLSIINVFGEAITEIRDILEICVQALIRMSLVNLKPSCMFVHQGIAASDAAQKMKVAKHNMIETLNEVSRTAAKLEGVEEKISSFDNVINFDINKHVFYFPNLWNGVDPMVTPNKGYTEKIRLLKREIISQAGRPYTVKEFSDHLEQVWKAVLHEDFVLSFKNILHKETTEKINSKMYDLQRKLNLEVQDAEYEALTEMKNSIEPNVEEASVSLERRIQHAYEKLNRELESFFDMQTKEKGLFADFKSKSVQDFFKHKEDLCYQSKTRLHQLREKKLFQKETGKFIESNLKNLRTLSYDLAVDSKDNLMSEDHLRQAFEDLWSRECAEIAKRAPKPQSVNLPPVFEQILNKKFPDLKISDHLKEKYFDKRVSCYCNISWIKKFSLLWFSDHEKNFQIFLQHLQEKVVDYVDKAEVGSLQPTIFLSSLLAYIDGISYEAEEDQSIVFNPKPLFFKEFSLSIKGIVCEILEANYKAHFEANDPMKKISQEKENAFQCFKQAYKGDFGHMSIKSNIENHLTESLTSTLIQRACMNAVKQIGEMEIFSDRSALEFHLLKELAEKEDFKLYRKYNRSPSNYTKEFIRQEVVEFLCGHEEDVKLYFTLNLDDIKVKLVKVSEDAVGDTIDEWVESFFEGAKQLIELPRQELQCVMSYLEPEQTHIVKKGILTALESASLTITNKVSELDQILIEDFTSKLFSLLDDTYVCCPVKCPFCDVSCSNHSKFHKEHYAAHHRPRAIVGAKWHKTTHFSIEICSNLVKSDLFCVVGDDPIKEFPYKNYKSAGEPYSLWEIKPSDSGQSYWKWVVCRFKKDFEDYYQRTFEGRGEIPQDWFEITKEEAVQSLKDD